MKIDIYRTNKQDGTRVAVPAGTDLDALPDDAEARKLYPLIPVRQHCELSDLGQGDMQTRREKLLATDGAFCYRIESRIGEAAVDGPP